MVILRRTSQHLAIPAVNLDNKRQFLAFQWKIYVLYSARLHFIHLHPFSAVNPLSLSIQCAKTYIDSTRNNLRDISNVYQRFLAGNRKWSIGR